jgi:hypothetical protein
VGVDALSETDSSAAIGARRQIARAQLARAEFLGRRRRRGWSRDVEDVGDQRGVRRPCGQGLEQFPGAGHRERQDQPVRLGEVQRLLDTAARARALVAQVAAGERVQQVGLDRGEGS